MGEWGGDTVTKTLLLPASKRSNNSVKYCTYRPFITITVITLLRIRLQLYDVEKNLTLK